MGRPTIYRRWKRKEELVAEAIESWRPHFALPDTGSLARDLEGMVDAMERALSDASVRRLWLLVMTEVSMADSLREAWWSAYITPRFEMMRAVFQRAIERGEIDASADIDRLMMLLSAALLYHYLMLPGRPTKNDIWRSVNFLVGRVRTHRPGPEPNARRAASRPKRSAARGRTRGSG